MLTHQISDHVTDSHRSCASSECDTDDEYLESSTDDSIDDYLSDAFTILSTREGDLLERHYERVTY